MIVFLVAIALLTASVIAIYLLLKSMGQDGVEVAAPGSCKAGRCGVPGSAAAEATCRQDEDQPGEPDQSEAIPAPDRQNTVAEVQSSRLG